MFDTIESESEYADKFGLSLFQSFDRDLMPMVKEVLSRFQAPNKCNGQDEYQRVYPLRDFHVGILKIETPGFERSKEHFDAPAFAVQAAALGQGAVAEQNEVLLFSDLLASDEQTVAKDDPTLSQRTEGVGSEQTPGVYFLLFSGHAHLGILPDSDDKGDALLLQVAQPVVGAKLPVHQQVTYPILLNLA